MSNFHLCEAAAFVVVVVVVFVLLFLGGRRGVDLVMQQYN